jgi:regulator of protease activity HflC (stomatin/prohibitin superfamily)
VLQRYFGVLILIQLAVLLLSTCVVFIDPGEQALLERFGRPVEGRLHLGPGGHLKWPWPIDRAYRYRTEQIQSFNIGFTPDPKTENQGVVLWKVEHTKEENFLVANRETSPASQTTNTVTGRRAPPVSLLTVSIPVQFQIRDLQSWVYNNENPTNLLQNVATREVVRYLVNADLDEVMSRERSQAAQTLRERIQAASDEHKLGATIVFVGLQDIHPPVKVAADYEKVISASHQMQSNILAAQAFTIRTNALAEAQATNLVDQALAFQVTRQISALAQAALFTNQIPAFQAAPQVYLERNYLQTFGRAIAQSRKYIVLSTNTDDVFVIDLQDKIRDDLLNVGVGPQK